MTDENKLRRILTNLLANAIKFTEAGRIDVAAAVKNSGLTIMVRDTGCGVPPDERSMLFTEFFQVDNSERNPAKGFGMGLAVAKCLAQQIGGDVVLKESSATGSCFELSIPTGE